MELVRKMCIDGGCSRRDPLSWPSNQPATINNIFPLQSGSDAITSRRSTMTEQRIELMLCSQESGSMVERLIRSHQTYAPNPFLSRGELSFTTLGMIMLGAAWFKVYKHVQNSVDLGAKEYLLIKRDCRVHVSNRC